MTDAQYREVMLTLWRRTLRFVEDDEVMERNLAHIAEYENAG